MGMKDTIEKLEKYQARLRDGKVEKIKPKHVQKVIDKLRSKQEEVAADLKEATKPAKRERLESKQKTVSELIEKAEWLLSKV